MLEPSYSKVSIEDMAWEKFGEKKKKDFVYVGLSPVGLVLVVVITASRNVLTMRWYLIPCFMTNPSGPRMRHFRAVAFM
jgi:hypothetical protein